VYDVLVAQVQNTVCTRADASGSVMLLGESEAAAYSECVQESDAQVPLGFKFVPLSKVIGDAVAASPAPTPVVVPSPPASATAQVDVGTRTAVAEEVSAAEGMLARLEAPDGPADDADWTGPSGYAMVRIAPGSFTMGSPASEDGREDDETQHDVTLTKGFLMGKTEVTQELWRSVMGGNPSESEYNGVALVGDRLPVQNVDW
jgi:formylglycine-generating enzyme required for sulfatase activity